jgi:hypothetical protein
MPRDTEKDFTFGDWVIVFGLAAIAVTVTEIIGLTQKWEDVIVFTVMLFTVVLLVLHELWRNPAFWRNLLPIFGMHIVAFALLAQVLPLGQSGFPKLPLSAAMMAEGVLILAVLYKRVRGGTRSIEWHMGCSCEGKKFCLRHLAQFEWLVRNRHLTLYSLEIAPEMVQMQ